MTKTAGISSEALKAKTGRTWEEWCAILDKAGAKKMSHREIVAFLRKRYRVGPWWQQMVTVGYEQARGLREKHQKAVGYSVSASKMFAAPAAALFRAWKEPGTRRRWLGAARFEVTTATPNKSLRIRWPEGDTRVDVNFCPKGAGRCQMSVEHQRLASVAAAKRKKAWWQKSLAALEGLV
jgi:hypothetical protein